MSCRWKKRDSELRLVRMRCRRSSAAVSSKVRSGCSVITATTRSACCSSGETLPPRGFGAALLLSLQRCIHLTTELTLTPKCSAASCRDAPASTISIARSRKSQEYDFGIVTPRVRESMLKQSPIHDRLGIPRFKSAGSRFSYGEYPRVAVLSSFRVGPPGCAGIQRRSLSSLKHIASRVHPLPAWFALVSKMK